MPGKANAPAAQGSNQSTSSTATGRTYNTQRRTGGRRTSTQRHGSNKRHHQQHHHQRNSSRGSQAEAAAAAATAANANNATVTAALSHADTQPSHRPARAHARPQHLDKAKLHRQESAAAGASTTASVASAASAAAATAATASASTRGLNVASPEFVPHQYQQSQPEGELPMSTLLTFSSVTSPLGYVGSTGIASSVASPLVFATSASGRQRSVVSPASPSFAQPEHANSTNTATTNNNADTQSTVSDAGGSAFAGSQSVRQLRGAYARATAAASAASAQRESSVASLSPTLTQHPTPLQQPQPQPHPQPQHPYATTPATPVPFTVPPTHLPPPQRRSTRETASSTPAVSATPATAVPAVNPVYAPSVRVVHPQFIDMTTGAASMTPFALHEDYEELEDGVSEVESAAGETGTTTVVPTPLPPSGLLLPRQQAMASQRRMCATTVAVLESHAAPTAQLSLMPSARRMEPQQQQQRQQQFSEEVQRESAAVNPTPRSQRRTAVTTYTTTTTVAANIARSSTTTGAPEVCMEETPQRRPNKMASAAASTATTAAPAATTVMKADHGGHSIALSAESNAHTMEHLYACLANTDERTEGGRSIGSKMGLTGSVRRGPPEHDADEGEESGTVTPTATPAKVLAAEGSPFVDAVLPAAAAADTTATVVEDAPQPNRRLLPEEDSAAVFSESLRSNRSDDARLASSQPPPQSNGNSHHQRSLGGGQLQRAMMQLMVHIQTNNSKPAAAAAATAPTTTATSAVTPQKRTTAAAGKDSTPSLFKTPDAGERMPSARPSASKSTTCRTITTIIHTPNTATTRPSAPSTTHAQSHHTNSSNTNAAADASSAAESLQNGPYLAGRTTAVTADDAGQAAHKATTCVPPPKSAQRSLASCLEAIAAQKGEDSSTYGTNIAVTLRNASLGQARANFSAAASEADASTSSVSHANPSSMPVPRSQRRNPRATSSVASQVTNTMPKLGEQMTVTASASVPTSFLNAAVAAPSSRYAVVIDGHMGRRVTAVSATPLKAGVCVLFEEDRGIDMGRVVQCEALADTEAAGALAVFASATSPLSRKDRPAPVLRPATAEEEYRWLYTDLREAETTLEPCREAAARLGLSVKVVGAVYQFNKAKLTFYYESDTRVDFRPLLPSLFSRFHCRIWMARVETANGQPDAADSRAGLTA